MRCTARKIRHRRAQLPTLLRPLSAAVCSSPGEVLFIGGRSDGYDLSEKQKAHVYKLMLGDWRPESEPSSLSARWVWLDESGGDVPVCDRLSATTVGELTYVLIASDRSDDESATLRVLDLNASR